MDMNGHPGRVTSRDTDRTEAPRGFPAVNLRESGSFPGGRKRGTARSLHYTPEEMTRRPNRLGAFPAGSLTAAVTSAPRPTRRPAQPVVSQPPRLPSRTWLPAVAAHRSRPGCGGGDCFRKRRPARPAADASGRCRSPLPPHQPAGSPLPPAPPPPSSAAAAAAATAARSVTSAPAGPSLPHGAAAGGGRPAPRGEGRGVGGGPAPSGLPCWPGSRELPAASTRSDLLLGRRVPQAAAAGPTAEDAGRGRLRPPRPPRVGFSELTNHGEGLRGKALGAGY